MFLCGPCSKCCPFKDGRFTPAVLFLFPRFNSCHRLMPPGHVTSIQWRGGAENFERVCGFRSSAGERGRLRAGFGGGDAGDCPHKGMIKWRRKEV
ncbi:hypothetical protein NDU88_007091 [Pleurodeles waltl]|uniref:Uncharacterized protein n=1 Tax=Pleurodeles waltl TaxID=8319 RepID=A0AAV7MHZ3_PLEWA|nr:hypothetical protein NDU88_007091 [Pleurodeles waltl]